MDRINFPIRAATLAALGLAQAASGQDNQVRLQQAFSLGQTIAVASPPGDHSRMFVVTLGGAIRIWDKVTNQVSTSNFVQLSSSGGANGVTGIAFHPQYSTNGYIYFWTGIAVERVLAQGDPATATLAEPGSRVTVLRIPTLAGQHVGGWIDFGTDGMLWVSTGDAHNSTNGQRTDNLMGRILRLDVDGADNIPGNEDDDAFPADALKNYSIPPDNPFVGVAGEDEIWANGLRNPFRCSFDMNTGDLYIADVGEAAREEISYQPNHHPGLMPGMEGYHGGRNYGWSVWEGTRCHTGSATCAATPQTPPIAEYPRSGPTLPPLHIATGSTIIGGYVYRGCLMPELQGWYVFADTGFGNYIWALQMENGIATAARQLLRPTTVDIYGFAQDLDGELFTCGPQGVHRILPADMSGRDVNGNGILDSCEFGCGADFNTDGHLDPDDLADFITCFFLDIQFPGFCAAADYNRDGFRDPDDLADFITRFFTCR